MCSTMGLGIWLVLANIKAESTSTLLAQVSSSWQWWSSSCNSSAASCDSWSSSAECCWLHTNCWTTAIHTTDTSSLCLQERLPLCCSGDVAEAFHYLSACPWSWWEMLMQFMQLLQYVVEAECILSSHIFITITCCSCRICNWGFLSVGWSCYFHWNLCLWLSSGCRDEVTVEWCWCSLVTKCKNSHLMACFRWNRRKRWH